MKKSQRGHLAVVPIAGQLRSNDRAWLRGGLIAGVTVAALIVPKNLGYAGIAGIPLQNGLYAAAAGAIVYGIFGSCRQISMGPSSGLAPVAAIDVVIGELPKLTGTDVTGSNPFQELGSWLGTLGEAQQTTMIVGVIALAVVFGLRAVAPRVPGALVLVVGGLLAAQLFDLGGGWPSWVMCPAGCRRRRSRMSR